MKSTIRITHFFAALLGFFITLSAHATTYTSINPGAWSDVTNVWSTNGGASPCGCNPGVASSGDVIIVNHAITVIPNLSFSSTQLIVNSTGSIVGAINISATNGDLDIIGGLINVSGYTQSGSTTLDVTAGGIFMTSGGFTIGGGVATVDNGLLSTGQFQVSNGAILNLQNAGRLNVTTSNLRNHGTINIDPTSCLSTDGGNIQNAASGVINGTGSLNSGGNIVNNGVVDVNIIWCANGTGNGMPTPPDCANANTICSAIVLPVELTRFEAVVYRDYALISWETASENNSSHFILYKSTDGKNWEEVAQVEAAGNSTSAITYEEEDLDLAFGTTYYLLEQYDNDGAKTSYDPISVYREVAQVEIGAYPNPVINGSTLRITNIADENGSLQLSGFSGRVDFQQEFYAPNHELEIPIENLTPGVYTLHILLDGAVQTTRIIVAK